jgi:hypothetical protein
MMTAEQRRLAYNSYKVTYIYIYIQIFSEKEMRRGVQNLCVGE